MSHLQNSRVQCFSPEIDRVPTLVELSVVAWHESKGEFKREKKIFGEGENKLVWKISK